MIHVSEIRKDIIEKPCFHCRKPLIKGKDFVLSFTGGEFVVIHGDCAEAVFHQTERAAQEPKGFKVSNEGHEHVGCVEDADSTFCDSNECWCRQASPVAPAPDMLGGLCSKCGHVHISIVCPCGCDISGELMKLNPVVPPDTLDTIIARAKSKTPCASNYECLLADLIGLRAALAPLATGGSGQPNFDELADHLLLEGNYSGAHRRNFIAEELKRLWPAAQPAGTPRYWNYDALPCIKCGDIHDGGCSTGTPEQVRELVAKWRRISKLANVTDGGFGDRAHIAMKVCADELEAALTAVPQASLSEPYAE